MSTTYVILAVLYIFVCFSLITVVLLQKKRTSGMGNVSGMTNSASYWDKNRGRSREGKLETYTKILGAIFFIFSVVMCVVR